MQLVVMNPVVIPAIEIPEVDGYKSGDIKIHNGTLNNIPDGWILCDGKNGTPPMVDCAVVGAGGSYQPNEVFGANSRATANHTLSAAQMPSHSHPMSPAFDSGYRASYTGDDSYFTGKYGSSRTANAGSSKAHNHGNIDVRQRSIALIWIMKL